MGVQCRSENGGFVFYASGSSASAISLCDCRKHFCGAAHPLGLEWHQIGSRLCVAPHCTLESAVICESYESSHRDGDAIQPQLENKKVVSKDFRRRLDSMSKYGLVARGDAHVYLRGNFSGKRSEQIWDHAPGIPIITAAGGQVTDLHGKPLDFG